MVLLNALHMKNFKNKNFKKNHEKNHFKLIKIEKQIDRKKHKRKLFLKKKIVCKDI